MSIPVIAFFNNKGGVGKTTLVYHLSWMFSDMGHKTLAVDLDPQSNLTASFLSEEVIEGLFESNIKTIYGSLKPFIDGTGDVVTSDVQKIDDNLHLILGDRLLTRFEDELSLTWTQCLDRVPKAFRAISAFWRIMQKSAEEVSADIIVADLGPNLGAINRSALIASDFVVIPLTPDLYSIQGLQNLGPSLNTWRKEWSERLEKKGDLDIALPEGNMAPVGYLIQRHSVRLDRPVRAFEKWISKMPEEYNKVTMGKAQKKETSTDNDDNCLALLKDYRSLMPLAHEANKPIFHLLPADGAIGAHMGAVQKAKKDFKDLAEIILEKTKIT